MKTLTHEKQKTAPDALKGSFGYTNSMQTPRVLKVIISTGVGKVTDKKKREHIAQRLARIAGQKAAPRAAKKSIATFKMRKGDTVGFQVTLHGNQMWTFLDKLIHVVLPRTRDFRGIKPEAIDEMGNITIGVKEHTVFPETSDEDVRDVFGLAITITTTAQTKEEAHALLRHLGLPLREREEK
jgi:large subunit ribosomal protein L5